MARLSVSMSGILPRTISQMHAPSILIGGSLMGRRAGQLEGNGGAGIFLPDADDQKLRHALFKGLRDQTDGASVF